MQKIQNDKIKESVYIETLDNGMKIIIIPKPNTNKKYIIWGTKFGSIDNHFIEPKTGKEIKVPDGVAHYLEHKMFEQENGVDSLYKLMSLGLDANAYTTNDHTAYLFGGTNNFYEGLDELMDYVQHPYFTDQNVEKERGIIGQEIGRYDDEPAWKLYINLMDCLYKNNPVKLDIAGTVESISHITKEVLYDCYNTFYHPSNMTMCISGNFEPEKIVEEVKKRLLPKEKMGEIKRIYPEKELTINKKFKEQNMEVNIPLFMIGYRDVLDNENNVMKQIAIEIILNSLIGKSSKLYQNLYNEGLLMGPLDFYDEFADEYSHVVIGGQSENPEKINEEIVNVLKTEKVSKEDFERNKKALYGEYVSEYDDVETIGRMFLQDSMRGINSLEFVDAFSKITLDYVNKIQKELFKEEMSALSIIRKEK